MKQLSCLIGVVGMVILCSIAGKSPAQQNKLQHFVSEHPDQTDTSRIMSFRKHITAHTFLSQKYTGIRLPGATGVPAFHYLPNRTVSVGLGATYRYYSFSLAFGIKGLNNDIDLRGETRSFDFQTQLYSKKWIVDFAAQLYKGYYLAPRDFVAGYPDYWLAPELKLRLFGVGVYHILNHKRFSYRASKALNEWQLKSAGSFVVGFEAYAGVLKNDGTIVPYPIHQEYPQGQVSKVRFSQIGPGIGYSHHFVIRKHFFASLTGTVSPVLGFTREFALGTSQRSVYIFPNYNARAVVGYFRRKWSTSLGWSHTNLSIKGAANKRPYQIQSGSFRFTIAYRFLPDKWTKKLLQLPDPYVEKVIPIQ